MARTPLIAGNWKMNGFRGQLSEISAMMAAYPFEKRAQCELMLAMPSTLLFVAAAAALGSGIRIGAQDCHAMPEGAHTGDLSARMLADAGASFVILGHSERRQGHGERDSLVRAKVEAALGAGLTVILCVGETRAEREAGRALSVVRRQLRGSLPDGLRADAVIIAYEPVWAIGTGLVPTLADIAAMHAQIRASLTRLLAKGQAGAARILYGGSVKPNNAAEILALDEVDGALVGGASLKAAEFMAIAACVSK